MKASIARLPKVSNDKLSREQCTDPENEASFYCKWNFASSIMK